MENDFPMTKQAWIVVVCFVATLFVIIPAYGISGNQTLRLTLWGYLIWLLFAASVAGLLGVLASYTSGRAVILVLAATLATCTISHLLIFDQVFSGRIDGENMGLAINSNASYIATAVYAVLMIGSFFVLAFQRQAAHSIAIVCTLAALASLGVQYVTRQPSNLILADRQPSSEAFRLSSKNNIIHLLPDGLQTDLVVDVLKRNHQLAQKFGGFTVFANHVGAFPSTAFTVPTLLSGRFFDVTKPTEERISEEITEYGLFKFLAEHGFEVHLAPLSATHCGKHATTCYPLNFGDLTPRGFYDAGQESLYNASLAMDLTALRILPPALAPWVFNQGNWRIANLSAMRQSIGVRLAPGLEEMAEQFYVDPNAPPTYRWHHYIGTHPPYKWDENCNNVGHSGNTSTVQTSLSLRGAIAQTECVLLGLSRFIEAIEALGILDQVIFVISADHGTSQRPMNLPATYSSRQVDVSVIGHARPALMIKDRGSKEPLEFSDAATSAIDVAPTVLGLAGLPSRGDGINLAGKSPQQSRRREFHYYQNWWFGEKPIPTVVYAVGERSSNPDDWHVDRFSAFKSPPSKFSKFNSEHMKRFQRGALPSAEPEKHGRWISGTRLSVLLASGRGNGISLVGHTPSFNKETTFSLRINGRPLASGIKFESIDGQHWATVSLCLPKDVIMDEGKVDLEFSRAVTGQHPTSPLSVVIHEITFTETADCS